MKSSKMVYVNIRRRLTMMKMVVTTASGNKYEKDIISVNFYNGRLVVVESDGKTESYTEDSLKYGGDGIGTITIM